MTGVPGISRQQTRDILAANQFCRALLAQTRHHTQTRQNGQVHVADPRAPDFLLEWDQVANLVVASLRSEAGRDPYPQLPGAPRKLTPALASCVG